MNKTCRVCLKEVKRATLLSDCLLNEPIYRHINSIANVNISADDGLPSKICPRCVAELEAAVNFKQKCENNNIILKTTTRQLIQEFLTDETEDAKHDNTIVKSEDDFDSHALASSYSPMDSPHGSHTQSVEGYNDSLDITKNDPDDYYITGSVEVEIAKSYDEYVPKLILKNESSNNKVVDLLQCDDCKEYFKTKCKLGVHWKRMHLKEKLVCQTCLRRFNSYKTFNHHNRNPPSVCKLATNFRIEYVNNKKRMFYCKQCDYKSTTGRHMVIHNVTHTGARPYTCDLCGTTHTQIASLLRHKETAHKLYKNIITCEYCGKLMKGNEKIYRHLKSHTDQSLQCSICGKTLKNKATLREHIKRHTGNKNVKCEFCPKLFTTVSQCTHHKSLYHLNKRQMYDCEYCPYKITRKSLVNRHQAKHVGSNVCCMKCGMFFESKHKLKIHELKHVNRPHVCNNCEKTYNRKDNLVDHYIKVHKTKYIKVETEQGKLSQKLTKKNLRKPA